ncbi:MAG: radical SAM protein [Bacteroidales bacterium]|nr:radical SAM protein [Bacteroidales bacterium]
MKQFLYLAFWFIRAKFFRIKKPLQCVIFITNRCNLSCKHCSVYEHRQPISKTTSQIREELEYAYRKGARFVDFEGGEPTLWTEEGKTVNDLIIIAKETGYYSCTITTNAKLSFHDSLADSIWVSLDGVGEVHDTIRGKGSFAALEKNIAECGHHNLSVNMVINNLNYNNVVQTIEYVKNNPHIKSISLNFHTPYIGTEYLFLDWEERAKVIDEIIKMKQSGYPIMNSKSGLKLMKHNNFKKQCWVSNFILVDGSRLDECPGKYAKVCDKCGYGMAAEMKSVFSFKPDTLLAGMRLRVKGKR